MVWSIGFFFASRQVIHHRYKQFFDLDEQDKQDDNEGVDDVAEVSPKQNTARFYFSLSLALVKEDITKLEHIQQMPVYLILNTASFIKDKHIQEQNELKKLNKNKL